MDGRNRYRWRERRTFSRRESWLLDRVQVAAFVAIVCGLCQLALGYSLQDIAWFVQAMISSFISLVGFLVFVISDRRCRGKLAFLAKPMSQAFDVLLKALTKRMGLPLDGHDEEKVDIKPSPHRHDRREAK
jgi:hypothetical protein